MYSYPPTPPSSPTFPTTVCSINELHVYRSSLKLWLLSTQFLHTCTHPFTPLPPPSPQTVCSFNGHDAASLWPITRGPTTCKTTGSLSCSHFCVLLHPILGILYLLQLATAQQHHTPTRWQTDCYGGVREASHRVTTILCTVWMFLKVKMKFCWGTCGW